jgi:transposase
MFTITGQPGQIFLALGATDLRRGLSGLAGMIRHELQGDPTSGALYGFCNRTRTTVKLFWVADGGAWVCTKRLARGTFVWPERGARTAPMTPMQLQDLLQGLTPKPVRARDGWWTHLPPPATSEAHPIAPAPRGG